MRHPSGLWRGPSIWPNLQQGYVHCVCVLFWCSFCAFLSFCSTGKANFVKPPLGYYYYYLLIQRADLLPVLSKKKRDMEYVLAYWTYCQTSQEHTKLFSLLHEKVTIFSTLLILLRMTSFSSLSLDVVLYHTMAINGRLRIGRIWDTPKVSMESRKPCRMIWKWSKLHIEAL